MGARRRSNNIAGCTPRDMARAACRVHTLGAGLDYSSLQQHESPMRSFLVGALLLPLTLHTQATDDGYPDAREVTRG